MSSAEQPAPAPSPKRTRPGKTLKGAARQALATVPPPTGGQHRGPWRPRAGMGPVPGRGAPPPRRAARPRAPLRRSPFAPALQFVCTHEGLGVCTPQGAYQGPTMESGRAALSAVPRTNPIDSSRSSSAHWPAGVLPGTLRRTAHGRDPWRTLRVPSSAASDPSGSS